jgi:hypothetical protein
MRLIRKVCEHLQAPVQREGVATQMERGGK